MKISLFILLVFSFVFTGNSQTPENFSVLFYNVENLFDPENDNQTEDDEFTPSGDRHWTYNRLNEKLVRLSKVILSASGWTPPELIGLCEIENRNVLEKLVNGTPLKTFPYKIIHKDSPDDRGIDVAFIYNSDIFYPLTYKYFPLKNENSEILKSREILYVKGILNEIDTLHLYVNHWPSRYGGLMETRANRILAAKTLRLLIDELVANNSEAKIIVMGDFNDQPSDESIENYLLQSSSLNESGALQNLSVGWMDEEIGTLKYQSQWFVFDQFIVSGALLQEKKGIAKIVKLPFLLENDKRWGGIKPNRTYSGYSYNGGFSDHLPILLEFSSKD